jgi:hypothetical protein
VILDHVGFPGAFPRPTEPDGGADTEMPAGEVVEVTGEKRSWRADSNRGPADYESAALPTELRQHALQI